MSVAQASLAARLQAAAPPVDGVPANYDEVIAEAVLQYSTDVPVIQWTEVTIVAGTSEYALPADFLSLIEMAQPTSGVIANDSGLVVMGGWSGGGREAFEIVGGSMVLFPTPIANGTRAMRYAGAHVLNDAGLYPKLTENGARLVMLLARHIVTSLQAAQSGAGWRYQIGDEMVDRSRVGEELRGQASALLSQYQREVRGLRASASVYRAEVLSGDVV